MVRKPIAVLISDVHYNLNTLSLADAAMRQAINTANELRVTLVVAGDLHDSKANLRGECVNAMIETFKLCCTPPAILVGNHDRLNEKAPAHSLNFLAPYAMIIDEPKYLHPIGNLIPYHNDVQELITALHKLDPRDINIMHQGITGSISGDYIQDKSAITVDDVAGLRIISGHYHTRQTIQLPNGGVWDYIGNPYTLTYAEVNDPPKGYQVLYNDGFLEFKPTSLRKHVVIKTDTEGLDIWLHTGSRPNKEDLLWLRIEDTKENLAPLSKEKLQKLIEMPFRLDLIPTDTITQAPDARLNLSEGPLLDSLIDSLSATSDERKTRLKDLWKGLK